MCESGCQVQHPPADASSTLPPCIIRHLLNVLSDRRLNLITTQNEVFQGDCLKKYEFLMMPKCETRPKEGL